VPAAHLGEYGVLWLSHRNRVSRSIHEDTHRWIPDRFGRSLLPDAVAECRRLHTKRAERHLTGKNQALGTNMERITNHTAKAVGHRTTELPTMISEQSHLGTWTQDPKQHLADPD
jgi:hypothetical protein